MNISMNFSKLSAKELRNELKRVHCHFKELAKNEPISKIMDMIYAYPNPDIDIKIEGETKKLHRHILAFRSGTFQRILVLDIRVPMYEMYIHGLKTAVFNLMVFYCYTGFVPDNLKSIGLILELYEAGKNYEMPGVVEHCHRMIAQKMNEKNKEQIKQLTQIYMDSTLKNIILAYEIYYKRFKRSGAVKLSD